MKKKIAILGSTGSIGKTLIEIIKKDKKNFDVILLTAQKNEVSLLKQAKSLNVKNLIITNSQSYEKAIKKISNKKVVVWYEQGLGDTLNFARYVLLLKKYTNQITFVVQDKLIRVLKNLDKEVAIKGLQEAENENFDFQIPLMSLIKILNESLERPFQCTIKLNEKSSKIDFDSDHLHIAFAHSGNQNYSRDHYRSMDISKLQNIFKLKNIHFYKLNNSNMSSLDPVFNKTLTDLSHLDIYDISILLSKFDLIFSTDTVFAHLCGILNINCVLLLSKNSDWRWFDDHKKTVWYKSIRIVKQKKLDDWDKVILLINRFLRLKSYTKKI